MTIGVGLFITVILPPLVIQWYAWREGSTNWVTVVTEVIVVVYVLAMVVGIPPEMHIIAVSVSAILSLLVSVDWGKKGAA